MSSYVICLNSNFIQNPYKHKVVSLPDISQHFQYIHYFSHVNPAASINTTEWRSLNILVLVCVRINGKRCTKVSSNRLRQTAEHSMIGYFSDDVRPFGTVNDVVRLVYLHWFAANAGHTQTRISRPLTIWLRISHTLQ